MTKKNLKSNRHKKLKAVDPFYIGERKLLIDKGLIKANQAPKKAEEKEDKTLPMKLRECMELNKKIKEKSKELNAKKSISKKKRKEKAFNEAVYTKADDRGAEVPLRKQNNFKKLDHESDASFLQRIDKEVETVIHRSQYENQFDCKLETQEDKVVVKKDKKMSERKRNSLNKHKERLKHKKVQKRLDMENSFESKVKKDQSIKFGDIVHQPPTITSFPKLRKKINNPEMLTIPYNSNKNGITENDRTEVIKRYRLMKSQGKFNV